MNKTSKVHSPENFADVQLFHAKFCPDLRPDPFCPRLLPIDLQTFREGFLQEELREFEHAYERGDIIGAADALVDLVYVALGTADLMGLPWQELWFNVQEANMQKERCLNPERSTRGSLFDVVKPAGWQPPTEQHRLLLESYARRWEHPPMQAHYPYEKPATADDEADLAGEEVSGAIKREDSEETAEYGRSMGFDQNLAADATSYSEVPEHQQSGGDA